ncbi:MAG: hypothetical protein FJ090_19065 [Deltaproteobacteria bacterium]|nr:hypothetical protein [Deltaproteobacteria bacterium]
MLLLFGCVPAGSTLHAESERASPVGAEDTAPEPVASEADSAAEEVDPSTDGAEDTAAAGEAPACGDDACDADESCWDCAADCGSCDCPTDVEAVFYTASAWNVLADALLSDPSPCADYYLSIPAPSGDKTTARADVAGEMHARSPRMHAMAEFHWGTWAEEPGSWYDKGVTFRARMDAAGYDVDAGDTWAINELPSTVRYDDATRQDALDAFRGLHDGPAGSTPAKGAVFVVGMGHGTQNFSVYEPYVQDWLDDATFWEQANLHVRWWAQEVYADPHYVCVDGSTTAERATAVNEYVQHFARHAEVGPDSANTAQSYLGRAYTPLMNAVWGSESGYGDTTVTLEQMEHFVSLEVYAARAWADDHGYPDGRVGFAWDRQDGVADADLEVLAGRLAAAIHYAYDAGGGAAQYACSPSGAYTWCACYVDGAAFDDGWQTFEEW